MIQIKFKECKDELLSEINKRLNLISEELILLNERVSHVENITISEIKHSLNKLENDNKEMASEINKLKSKQLKQVCE